MVGEDAAAGGADRVAQRDARAVDVELVANRRRQPQPLSTASTCGAKASFSSTRSMSFQPRPVRLNSRSTAGTGPMPMREGSQPAAAQLTNQPIGSRPSFLQLVFGDHQAGGGRVVLLAGVAGGDHAVLLDRAACRAIPCWRRRRTPSSWAKMTGSPFFCGTGDRAPVRRRTCRRPRPWRALVAARGVFVAFLAGDVVVAGEVVGGLDHAADHAEALDRLAHHPAARQAVVHGHRSPRAPLRMSVV
jgi:hypothetical protein